MESSLMAIALVDEIRTRASRSGDWERDFTRLQHQADIYERNRAIKAALMRIVRFFKRRAGVPRRPCVAA